MALRFPYGLDGRGRTAEADHEAHVRGLVEQVLFTQPGERVNRPTFGSGLHQLVFAPMSDEMTSAVQVLVEGALQQWVGDRILLHGVDVTVRESALEITVRYVVRRTQEAAAVSFTRELGP